MTLMSLLPPGWKAALSTTRVGDVFFYHPDGGGTTTEMPTPQTPTDIPNWYPAKMMSRWRKAGAAPVTPALQPRAVAPEDSAGTPPLAKVPQRHPPETPAVAKSPYQGRPVSPSRSEISRGISKSASLAHVPMERVGAARAAGMTPTQPPTPPPAKLGAEVDEQGLSSSARVFVGNSAMPKQPTFVPAMTPRATMPGVRFFAPLAGDMGGTGGIMGVRMGGHGAIMGSMGVGGGTGYSTMSDGFLQNLQLSGGHGSMAVATGFPVLDQGHQEEGFPDGFPREGGGGNRPNSPADWGYRPY